ncbi:MAG: hypothetical protein NT034_02160 [Candidatus Magasanikbacteria bacterium]|nr:hypothetical protein [Candidatus Magasanikbacteria bacterium]
MEEGSMFDIESEGKESNNVYDLFLGIAMMAIVVWLRINTCLDTTLTCVVNLSLQMILFLFGATLTLTAAGMILVDLFDWLTKGGRK